MNSAGCGEKYELLSSEQKLWRLDRFANRKRDIIMTKQEENNDEELLTMAQGQFFSHVKYALKNYHDLNLLSRSILCHSSPVKAALVVEDSLPTSFELAHALRVVLRWAVDQLAPAPSKQPIGRFRPENDPTWGDRLWRNYNILRHRYLDTAPLEKNGTSKGKTSRLMNYLDLTSHKKFKIATEQAIREVSELLQQEMSSRRHYDDFARSAVDVHLSSLKSYPQAFKLLESATIFSVPFPRRLLMLLAEREIIDKVEAEFRYLRCEGYVIENGEVMTVQVPKKLRRILYECQPAELLRQRHSFAADYYLKSGMIIEATRHLILGDRSKEAAEIILKNIWDLLTLEKQSAELCEVLSMFTAEKLNSSEWFKIQQSLGAAVYLKGDYAASHTICRRALKGDIKPEEKAEGLLWLAMLYRSVDIELGLQFLDEALACLPVDHPESLYILLHKSTLEMEKGDAVSAEKLILKILNQADPEQKDLIAYAHLNLTTCCRMQKKLDEAEEYARKSLVLWELEGSSYQIASCYNELAVILLAKNELRQAFKFANLCYSLNKKLKSDHGIAISLITLGKITAANGKNKEATEYYHESLLLCKKLDWPRMEMMGHAELVKVFMKLNEKEKARGHWIEAFSIATMMKLDNYIEILNKLKEKIPELQSMGIDSIPSKKERTALNIVHQEGYVTRNMLAAQLDISDTSAYRCLSEMVKKGILDQERKGRSTYYVVAGEKKQKPKVSLEIGTNKKTIYAGKTAMKIALKGERLTTQILMNKTGITRSTAQRILKRLTNERKLVRKGKGRSVYYSRQNSASS